MGTNGKIVLVDDDLSVLRCYERLLRRSGYRTVGMSESARLLEQVHDHADAGLLIVDYQMPKMNGILLLERLRERGFLAPVLLISALTSQEVREKARRLGVARILEKPVQPTDLLALIREIVGPGAGSEESDPRPTSAAG